MVFRRPGFTLIEMIVSMAILGTLLTIVFYTTRPEAKSDRRRVDDVIEVLGDLTQAIAGNEPTKGASSFHQVIGGYPAKLSQLTIPITGTDKEICGSNYLTTAPPAVPAPPGNTQNWKNPFYYRQLSTAGTILAKEFTANDALVLIQTPGTPNVSSIAGVMAIRLPTVANADAESMDLEVDGVLDGAAGTVRYSSTDPTSLDYYITISGC